MVTPVLIASALPVLLIAVTVFGSRRRGAEWPVAVLHGLFFPAAWIAWFIDDNHRAGRRAFRGR